jgi:hypothetical protein
VLVSLDRPIRVTMASRLVAGDVIRVGGEGLVVRAVELGAHKDAVIIRLRGHEPIHAAWNDPFEVVR